MSRRAPILFLLVAFWIVDPGADRLCAQGTLVETLGVQAAQEEAQARRLKQQQNNLQPGGQASQGQTSSGSDSSAAEPKVQLSDNPSDTHAFKRGDGGYVNVFKLLAFWLLFLLWVATTDWVNRDCFQHRFSYAVWNSAVFFPFVVLFPLTLWLLPFIISFCLSLLSWAVPLVSFIVFHNRTVEKHQRVLTPDHFRYLFATTLNKLGAKMDVEKRAEYEKGADVDLIPRGGATDRDNSANLLTARQSPGYVLVKNLIADAVSWRATAVRFDFTRESATLRYQIDGLWREIDTLEREAADVLVAVMNKLCALDINERVKRQVGSFGAAYEKSQFNCRLLTETASAGERAVVRLEGVKQSYHALSDLGMRDKLIERFLEILGGDRGMVVFSAMPEGGLTTTIDVSLEETDRLMRSFVAIEPENRRERDIQNVEVTTYRPAVGETPATVLPKLIRTYPDVIVVRNLSDAESAKILCSQVGENRLVITSIRAKESAEALLRVLMLKIPPKLLAPAITAVVNQRLIRRLCDQCKVAYEPTADVLKRLGIPEGRVQALYRPPTAEEVTKPCPKCRGIGYFGRTSIFELLVVDDNVRNMLLNQPNLTKAKKAARAAGMRSLQEEGILLVAKGVTSIAELTRVLKK